MDQHITSEQSNTAVVQLCDRLGRRDIALRIGRTVAAVSNATSGGAFPAGWYLVIRQMCDERGLECPDSLFRFVRDQKKGAA